jgi:hypothetical protein
MKDRGTLRPTCSVLTPYCTAAAVISNVRATAPASSNKAQAVWDASASGVARMAPSLTY